MLVHEYLRSAVERDPEKDFLIHRGVGYSYGQLSRAVVSAANWLGNIDLEPGFRAGILTDDPFDYVTAYFAILTAGGAVVGLNTQTTDRTLESILNDCQVSVVFTSSRFRKYFGTLFSNRVALRSVAVRGEVPADTLPIPGRHVDYDSVLAFPADTGSTSLPAGSGEDIAQIIYTSGTTGAPKGVVLTHSNLVANTDSIVEYLELTPADRVMAVLPFFYSYGNSLLLTHVAAGGSLVVNQQFLYPNVILKEMSEYEATGFSGVPSTFAILLNQSALRDYAYPHLRYITQAGGPMSPALAMTLKEILPGVQIFIMYGQTEASARLSYLEPAQLERKTGSIGKAIPGVTLRVLGEDGQPVPVGAVGEIVASGGNIMRGYWGRPEETAMVLRRGALWTGDLARIDDEGFIFVVGRKSDMIKSGSHRVGPKEIEDTLLEHETIHEAAVVGLPDEILGESICAFIVLKPGMTCTERDLGVHCRKLLSAYMVPRDFVFLDELPKTVTGKVRKTELKTGNFETVAG